MDPAPDPGDKMNADPDPQPCVEGFLDPDLQHSRPKKSSSCWLLGFLKQTISYPNQGKYLRPESVSKTMVSTVLYSPQITYHIIFCSSGLHSGHQPCQC